VHRSGGRPGDAVGRGGIARGRGALHSGIAGNDATTAAVKKIPTSQQPTMVAGAAVQTEKLIAFA
jgi:hypothetical protein